MRCTNCENSFEKGKGGFGCEDCDEGRCDDCWDRDTCWRCVSHECHWCEKREGFECSCDYHPNCACTDCGAPISCREGGKFRSGFPEEIGVVYCESCPAE